MGCLYLTNYLGLTTLTLPWLAIGDVGGIMCAYDRSSMCIHNSLSRKLQLFYMHLMLWYLQRKAGEKRKRLEETQGQQMFKNAAADLLHWMTKTKQKLHDPERPFDVSSAEEMQKKHEDLAEEIKAKDDEYV